MPKFVTIGYGDRAGYERTASDVRNAAHAHDEELRKRGALLGIAGASMQVRNPDAGQVQTLSGSFMSSPLPVAGFAVIEAADLAEAIDMVSQSPTGLTLHLADAACPDEQSVSIGLPLKPVIRAIIAKVGVAARPSHAVEPEAAVERSSSRVAPSME